MGSAVRIASRNLCISTPLWDNGSFIVGLFQPCRNPQNKEKRTHTHTHTHTKKKKEKPRHSSADPRKVRDLIQNVRNEGLRLRGGGSLHDGFGGFKGFNGSGKHLALLLLVLQDTAQRGNRDAFGCVGVNILFSKFRF